MRSLPHILLIFLALQQWKSSLSQKYEASVPGNSLHAGFGQTSECAVVLQRTYISGKSHSPLFGGFLNVIKAPVGSYEKKGNVEEICIRYVDINRAVQQAKYKLRYIRPPNINSLEPSIPEIAATGELNQLVTKILAQQFKLSPDEILNGLSLIDTSRTLIWDECPAHVKPIPCTIERYRTYTGHCNNLKHPSWGAANTPFVRFLPPAYSDGIDGPRVSIVDKGPLPSPRLITSIVHKDYDHPNAELSILLMSWGQFIDHDLTLAAPPRNELDHDFDCCSMKPHLRHPLCMTMEIPTQDPFFSHYERTCMDFKRSVAGQRPNCALGPRVHVNTLTSAIDANFLYGSTDELAKRLRLFKGGLMKMWDKFQQFGLKGLLPPEMDNPERDCIGRPRHLFCFIAGDERVNEQIHLTVLHTLYVRDHNRMAIELGRLNPHWDDEKIYQETRHIIAAAVQFITYNEFLPMVVGEDHMHRYNLTLQTHGYWNGYNPNVHFGPAHGFQAAAFRFGHTFIQGNVRRYNKYHEFLGEDLLRNLLRQPFIVYEPGKMDELIGGLINTPAQTYDPFITQEVSEHLFQEPHLPYGLDLPAINLARGREHGVPGYNAYREWCGLGRAETFEQLEPYLKNRTAFLYSQIYKHPDDIDLWSGGISEYPMPGAIIGPTFACIVSRQFMNIRRGDRFWFENSGLPSSFTPDQLIEIRKATQAKIICENADDMPTIQKWVMKRPHPIYNPRYNCEDLPSIDLRYWQEDPINGGYPFRRK
ncbi:peroxidase-like protein [Dinothrombium tinctorium]|uniref:Peroxidase-like protein n=1 Tax=Dinothrombium tinctorium TaxID=1965070 RepID=A0A3S3S7T0_9ACAR|nr:peroxidase-like protein [Dinothrombium tinctorium]